MDWLDKIERRPEWLKSLAILGMIAQTIKSCIRTTDLVARLGGDEFVLLLPGADRERALPVLENVRQCLLTEVSAGIKQSITYSIGAVVCREKCDIQQAIKEADEMMYGVKNSGKDRVNIKIGHG